MLSKIILCINKHLDLRVKHCVELHLIFWRIRKDGSPKISRHNFLEL